MEFGLKQHIQEYDTNEDKKILIKEKISKAKREQEFFVSLFPRSEIGNIEISDYVLGKSEGKDKTFSYLIEYGSTTFGKIGAASALKFVVYYSQKKQEYDYSNHFKSYTEAYDATIKLIAQCVAEAKSAIETKNWVLFSYHISQLIELGDATPPIAVISKIIAMYFPDEFIRIWSHRWLNNALDAFQIKRAHLSEGQKATGFYQKMEQLMRFKNSHQIMQKWSNAYFSYVIGAYLKSKIEMEQKSRLLDFLKSKMNMKSNYQPIVIKMLLEAPNHTITIQDIRKKFDELNFDRGNFVSSTGKPMGNNAIDSVKKALKKYARFPEGTSDGNVTLIEKTYDESTKDECLKICGQKIAKYHMEEIAREGFTIWGTQPGSRDSDYEYLDEFLETNSIGCGWNKFGNLSRFPEKSNAWEFIRKEYPDEIQKQTATTFSHDIKKKDIIVLTKGQSEIIDFGIVISDYEYLLKPNEKSYSHRRRVVWLNRGSIKKENMPDELLLGMVATINPMRKQENIDSMISVLLEEERDTKKVLTSEEEELDAVTIDAFDRALKVKPNLILYGPPGTGKTWNANEIAKHIIKKNNSFPTWKLCAKRILFENSGKSLPYTTITEQILDKKLRFETSAETPQETLRSRLADDIKDNGTNSIFVKTDRGEYGFKLPLTFKAGIQLILELNGPLSYLDMTKQLLEKNIIHTDGETPEKTLLAVITDEIKKNPDDSIFVQTSTPGTYDLRRKEITIKSFIQKVTFHPSYSYEDFVEGFRPNQKEGETPYVLEKGIFQQICNTADKDPSNKYVLIIDEINRGNIPKIFGELITLIEKDKRNSGNSLKLTYSKNSFFVPENLIIIGTMNTADKSLMQMDDALKRRFVFEELMPDTKLLEDHLKENNVPKAEDYSKILKRINEKITGDGKNKEALLQFRDRQIGHSYFWNIGKENNPDEDLQSIIKYDIIPLLQDYFYGDYSKMKEILTNRDNEKESVGIIGEDNRTTELVNDISKSSDLKNYLLEI